MAPTFAQRAEDEELTVDQIREIADQRRASLHTRASTPVSTGFVVAPLRLVAMKPDDAPGRSAIEWPLATERLRLRLHHGNDEGWLYELYSRPDVARYLLDEPWTREVTNDKLTERLSKNGLDSESGALALVIEHEGVAIGDVALWLTDREHRQGEIGWVLAPEHGGRGFASEAVRAVLDLGFHHYQLHRITAQMDARNSASAALARRVGLRLEAHHIQDWFSKGEWTDTLIYARLASETPQRNQEN